MGLPKCEEWAGSVGWKKGLGSGARLAVLIPGSEITFELSGAPWVWISLWAGFVGWKRGAPGTDKCMAFNVITLDLNRV